MEFHIRVEGLSGIYLNIKITLTYCDKQISTARVFSPVEHCTIRQAVFSLREERILKVVL